MKEYFAYCIDHDWEGARWEKKSDAEKDLRAHKELFPNEKHIGSGIGET